MGKNNIIEYELNNEKVFEFNKIESFEDYGIISDILITELKSKLIDQIEGPSENIGMFEKDGVEFVLISDFDYGNIIKLKNYSENNLDYLRNLAEKVCDIYTKKY